MLKTVVKIRSFCLHDRWIKLRIEVEIFSTLITQAFLAWKLYKTYSQNGRVFACADWQLTTPGIAESQCESQNSPIKRWICVFFFVLRYIKIIPGLTHGKDLRLNLKFIIRFVVQYWLSAGATLAMQPCCCIAQSVVPKLCQPWKSTTPTYSPYSPRSPTGAC